MDELLEIEEIYWRQRSRAVWLKDGDKNTKYFHHKANQRNRRNAINQIKDSEGRWVRSQRCIEEVAEDYFTNLFSVGNTHMVEDVCSHIRRTLSGDNVSLLSSPFTREEVERAVKQLGPLKAPGSDGFPSTLLSKILKNSRKGDQ